MIAVSSREGITSSELNEVNQFESSHRFDEADRLVLRYADEMTKTPVDVPQELFEQLKQKFSDKQLIELTSVIAFENYRARQNHALGIESAEFAEGASCRISTQP